MVAGLPPTAAGVDEHCPPEAVTSVTTAPETGAFTALSKTTPAGSVSVIVVAMRRPQPRISASKTSNARPSRILSPATTGGARTGIDGATKIPVSGPVSVAVTSSRSPLGPVTTIVRVSTASGAALHEAASARSHAVPPMTAQKVGTR